MLTSFGKACYVKTPSASTITTNLTNCSNDVNNPVELQSFNEIIEAEEISGAHTYIFHFFETTNNTLVAQCTTTTTAQPYTWQTSLDNSQVNLLDLNTVYEVKVKARILKAFGGGITSYGQSCYIKSPNNGPTVSLTTCETDVNNPQGISDGDVVEAVIDPAINSIYEYKYIFTISINGTYIKTVTTEYNNDRRKLCLVGSASGITSAKLNSLNIGDVITIEAEAWVKNGYNPSGPFPIILPTDAPCYATYLGKKSAFISENKIKLKLYPNPNDGTEFYLNASGFDNIKDNIVISITDIYGKIVYHEKLNNNATQIITTINLNTPLSAGVYLVKVAKGNNALIKKMVVQ